MCWVVARLPKIGGVVNTTRRSQNGPEAITRRTVESLGADGEAPWLPAARSLDGRTAQARGIRAATATT